MGKTSIEWVVNRDGSQGHTINPIRARTHEGDGHYCEKVSAGCANCYASTLQRRFRMPAFGSSNKRGTVQHYLSDKHLMQVLRRKKPTTYFWQDMSDLFGDWVQDAWIDKCFAVMAVTPQHTHMVLTKRSDRMRDYFSQVQTNDRIQSHADEINTLTNWGYRWPFDNAWLGVSAENQEQAALRLPDLVDTPAANRFVSAEPLLGPLDICPDYIDLVIVGHESGPKRRRGCESWTREIMHQCRDAGVAFFNKQMQIGGKINHNMWEFPEDLRVRQLPYLTANGKNYLM